MRYLLLAMMLSCASPSAAGGSGSSAGTTNTGEAEWAFYERQCVTFLAEGDAADARRYLTRMRAAQGQLRASPGEEAREKRYQELLRQVEALERNSL